MANPTNQPTPESWHLSKSISVSHLLTTCTLAVGLVLYLANIEADQKQIWSELDHSSMLHESVEEQIWLELNHIKSIRLSDNRRHDAKFTEIKTDLKDISKKLDRLIEQR